ncbi:MAG: YbfB/YjiJ family MFS transporter [Rhodospirillales bacterium]|nr:YbfB/YjiJ family MFS transporter [Rhodospirillales bacterium]
MERKLLLAGCCALIMAMGIGRFAYTALLPAMGLNDSQAGFLASANYAGYLIGAIACAAFSGRRRPPFQIGLALSILTTAALAVTTDWRLWLGLRFLAGLASAGVFVLGSAMVLESLADRRRGGLHFAGVGLGIALAGLVAMAVPEASAAWAWLAGAALLLAVPGWLWIAEPPRPAPASASATGPLRSFLVLLGFAYFCEGVGYIVSGTFLVSLVKRLPGLEDWAILSWVLVGLAAAPSAILWAAAGRRLGGKRALILAHFVQALGIALPALSSSPAAVMAGAALFGGTFIGIVALTLTLAGGAGRMVGILTALYGIGQIIGPLMAAALLPYGATLPLLAAAGFVILGALPLVPLARR